MPRERLLKVIFLIISHDVLVFKKIEGRTATQKRSKIESVLFEKALSEIVSFAPQNVALRSSALPLCKELFLTEERDGANCIRNWGLEVRKWIHSLISSLPSGSTVEEVV